VRAFSVESANRCQLPLAMNSRAKLFEQCWLHQPCLEPSRIASSLCLLYHAAHEIEKREDANSEARTSLFLLVFKRGGRELKPRDSRWAQGGGR
jgi:hypothetical protein